MLVNGCHDLSQLIFIYQGVTAQKHLPVLSTEHYMSTDHLKHYDVPF